MGDQIPTTPITPPSGGVPLELATFWRNLLPWDDLNAKNIPERWLKLGSEILPVLSILTAPIGPSGPRALKADSAGRLLANVNSNVTEMATAVSSVGATTISVPDATLYTVGGFALHVASDNEMPLYRIVAIPDPQTIKILGNINIQINPGDNITSIAYSTVDSRITPSEEFRIHRPTANNIATVTLNAIPALRGVVDGIVLSAINGAAGVQYYDIQVYDGPVVNGVILFYRQGQVLGGPDAMDRFEHRFLGLQGSPNNDVFVQITPAIANVQYRLWVGGHHKA